MSDATYAGGLPPAGWYPDPDVPGQHRWWDGYQWYASWPAPARLRAARGLGMAVVVLLALSGLLSFIGLLGGIALSPGPKAFDSPTVAFPLAYLVFSAVVGMVTFPVQIATVVVWCCWQVRVLSIVGATGLRRRPVWHVASWLIPVCNLVAPLWNMQGLWRSSGLRGQGLIGLWWSSILMYCALVVGSSWLTDGVDIGYRWTSAAISLVMIVGTALAICVVRRLTAAADATAATGAKIEA